MLKFVFNVNLGESVGMQTISATQDALEDYMASRRNEFPTTVMWYDIKRTVTLNIYKTLQEFFEIHKEMDNTGYITEEQICGVHRTP